MKLCTFPGCTNKHRGKGLCTTHLYQQSKGYELRPVKGAKKNVKDNVKKKENVAITGSRQAAALLGIPPSRLQSILRSNPVSQDPPTKVTARGPEGWSWSWRDQDHLFAWYKEVTVPKAVPVLPSPKVVGLSAAASFLGVKANLIASCLIQLADGPTELLPKRTIIRGSKGKPVQEYAWDTEEELAAWWDKVTQYHRDVLGIPLPSATESSDPRPLVEEIDGDEVMIRALIGEGMAGTLLALRSRLDTKENRSSRTRQGASAEIPLREVLLIVVGLGLSNWPEDVDG